MRKLDIIDSVSWDESEYHFLHTELLDMSLYDDVYEEEDKESEEVESVEEEEEEEDDFEFMRKINLNVPSGTAKAVPPVGPTLAQFGVDVKEFCSAFNEMTPADLVREEVELRVLVYLFKDLSILYFIKSPPLVYLFKMALMQKREEGFSLTAVRGARQGKVSRRRYYRSRVAISLLVLYKVFIVKYMFGCYSLPHTGVLRAILSSLYGSRYFIYDKI